MVEVYSAKWCISCTSIKRTLTNNNIDFTEIDIDTEQGMNKAKQLNIRNIPVTVIGDKKFVGSDQETVKNILEELNVKG